MAAIPPRVRNARVGGARADECDETGETATAPTHFFPLRCAAPAWAAGTHRDQSKSITTLISEKQAGTFSSSFSLPTASKRPLPAKGWEEAMRTLTRAAAAWGHALGPVESPFRLPTLENSRSSVSQRRSFTIRSQRPRVPVLFRRYYNHSVSMHFLKLCSVDPSTLVTCGALWGFTCNGYSRLRA